MKGKLSVAKIDFCEVDLHLYLQMIDCVDYDAALLELYCDPHAWAWTGYSAMELTRQWD
jgi:hypothetical protein